MDNTLVIAISKDLPFAQSRFCTTEGIENVIPASAFRASDFSQQYGIEMVDGPLAGLLARAVVVIDENFNVIYEELVPEITQEPNYYNPQIEMFAHFKTKSSFHKTKRII